MYIDSLLLLSDGQAITADAVSENTIDLGVARAIANGRPLYVVVVVDETFEGGTSLAIEVVTDTVADLSSPTVQCITDTFLQAVLTAGRDPIVIPIANVANITERYLGLKYDDTGEFTAGKVTAFVTLDPPRRK